MLHLQPAHRKPVVAVRKQLYNSAQEQELPDNATGHAIFMARQRATMAWSVSTLLQLRAAGSKPYLSNDEMRESTFLGDLFLATFQRLAVFNVHAASCSIILSPSCTCWRTC